MPVPCEAAPPPTYQLHVLLHDVEPAIWRRLRVRSDTTLASLHVLLQIAFTWRGWSSHGFLIRGKRYGRGALPESAPLSQFRLRAKERLTYEYGYEWRVQVRLESVLDTVVLSPMCVAGARAGPSERPGTPDGYVAYVEHREPPWDEQCLMIETIAKFVDAQPGKSVREIIGDMDAFATAVSRVRAYYRNDPARFERRVLNQRFQMLAQDDQSWRGDDETDDSSDDRWIRER
jgi:hypothetical protein